MPKLIGGSRGGRRSVRARRGFTLTELMIVIVLMAVVMSMLTALFLSQQRFYGDVHETAAVRRELRTGAGILPLDIRGLSGPGGDIEAYNSTRLVVKAPIGSAVICDIDVDRRAFHIFPTNLGANTLSSFWTDPLPSDPIFVFDDNEKDGAEDDVWRPHEIGSITSSSRCDVPGTPFTNLAADAAAQKPRMKITLAGTATLEPYIEVGAVVRFTRRMEYQLRQPSAGAGYYIMVRESRNKSWTDFTPVSGPYTSTGLRFAFYDTLGTEVTSGDPASLRRIARVDVAMHASGAEARSIGRDGPITDSLFMSVGIRNFR